MGLVKQDIRLGESRFPSLEMLCRMACTVVGITLQGRGSDVRLTNAHRNTM